MQSSTSVSGYKIGECRLQTKPKRRRRKKGERAREFKQCTGRAIEYLEGAGRRRWRQIMKYVEAVDRRRLDTLQVRGRPAVYLMFGKSGNLYCGSAKCAFARREQHYAEIQKPMSQVRAQQDLYAALKRETEVFFLIVRVLETEQQAREVERYLIGLFQPSLNRCSRNVSDLPAGAATDFPKKSKRRPRKRPPPRKQRASERAKELGEVRTASILSKQNAEALARSAETKSSNYHALYWQQAKKVRGPVLIYAPYHYILLLKWLERWGTQIDVDALHAHKTQTFTEYCVLSQVNSVVTRSKCATVRSKVRMLMDKQGLPSSRRIRVYYRFQSEREALMRCAKSALAKSKPKIRSFLRNSIQFCPLKMAPRMRCLCLQSVQVAQNMSVLGRPQTEPDFSKWTHLTGVGSRPLPPVCGRFARKQAKSMLFAAKRNRVVRLDEGYLRERQMSEVHKCYRVEMDILASMQTTPGICCYDDKDADCMFRMPASDYEAVLTQGVREERDWTWVQTPREEIIQSINDTMQQEAVKVGKIKSLPYYYCTVKGKCFTRGASGPRFARTCARNYPHSHFRKVISYKKCISGRSKATCRWVGEKVMESVSELDHNEILDLARAKDVFVGKCRQLGAADDEHDCTCTSCGSAKPPACAGIYDAVSFFENVPVSALQEGCGELHRIFSGKTYRRGGKTYQFRDLTSFVVTFVKTFRHIGIGRDGVVRVDDERGVPIGGPISKLSASIVLCIKEGKLSLGLLSFLRRYVDDILVCSRQLCQRCILNVISEVYSPISFEEERFMGGAGGNAPIRWLDCNVMLNSGGIWALCNAQKTTHPPENNERDSQYHRAVMVARVHRIICTNTETTTCISQLLAELQLWAAKNHRLGDIAKYLGCRFLRRFQVIQVLLWSLRAAMGKDAEKGGSGGGGQQNQQWRPNNRGTSMTDEQFDELASRAKFREWQKREKEEEQQKKQEQQLEKLAVVMTAALGAARQGQDTQKQKDDKDEPQADGGAKFVTHAELDKAMAGIERKMTSSIEGIEGLIMEMRNEQREFMAQQRQQQHAIQPMGARVDQRQRQQRMIPTVGVCMDRQQQQQQCVIPRLGAHIDHQQRQHVIPPVGAHVDQPQQQQQQQQHVIPRVDMQMGNQDQQQHVGEDHHEPQQEEHQLPEVQQNQPGAQQQNQPEFYDIRSDIDDGESADDDGHQPAVANAPRIYDVNVLLAGATAEERAALEGPEISLRMRLTKFGREGCGKLAKRHGLKSVDRMKLEQRVSACLQLCAVPR